MSTKSVTFVNPKTGAKTETYTGFAWDGFLFGIFGFLTRIGMNIKVYLVGLFVALALFLLGVFPLFLTCFIFPFITNDMHRKYLEENGWQPEGEVAMRDPNDLDVDPKLEVRCPACREIVRRDAIICKHCRSTLTPTADFKALVSKTKDVTNEATSKLSPEHHAQDSTQPNMPKAESATKASGPVKKWFTGGF
jgi:hypothetical protein